MNEAGEIDTKAVGVRFSNAVHIRRLPVSCPHEIMASTIVALSGSNPIGFGDEIVLDDWELHLGLFPSGGIPADALIRVPADRTLHVRGCSVGSDGTGTWGRWAATFANPLTVDGTLQFEQTAVAGFSSGVTGSGLVKSLNSAAEAVFSGSVDFDGEIRLDGFKSVTFTKSARVSMLTGGSGQLGLSHDARLMADVLAGNVVLAPDSSGTLHVGRLAVGAAVTIPASVRLRVDAAEGAAADVTLSGDSGTYSISGPETDGCPAVRFALTYPTGATDLVLGGRVILDAASHAVTLSEGCEWAPPPVFEDWQSKVALWLDASALESFDYADDQSVFRGQISDPYRGTDSGRPLVYQWRDCRSDHTTSFTRTMRIGTGDVNTYRSYGKALLLAHVTNTAVNASGRPYVDASSNMSHAQILPGAVPAQWVIAVFGSQSGGGRAVFGNQDGAFARPATGRSSADAAKYAITTNAFETYIDGTAVDPTETAFSGGWQIISMNTEGNSVQGLGFSSNGNSSTPSDRGYCNYAEVLVFSDAPTARERRVVEKYLADKWDISISHTGEAPLGQELTLAGAGRVVLSSDTIVHGMFQGVIDVNGFTLTLADDANLRKARVTGTGRVVAVRHRQLPTSNGFTGEMLPPPPGLLLICR